MTRTQTAQTTAGRWDWPIIVVLTVAVSAAALLLVRFLAAPRRLWDDAIHDRNAHLYSGLCLATNVAHGRLGQLFSDLDSFRSWPPLHDGLLVGAALLLGRGDERWAVLPSLAGWVGTAVFAALLARRAVFSGGTVAGMLAALFVLTSPAQRAFATDVMLESLGACLTLSCLFYYLRAVQERSVPSTRALALALTLLFFHKYNYWLLVVFGLGVDLLWTHRATVMDALREHGKNGDAGRWLARQAKRPLNWLLLLLTAAVIAITATGGTDLELFGKRISVHSGANLLTVAYAVFFLRVWLWYRRVGRARIAQSPRTRALWVWHVCPVAVWFLWPQKLAAFLWVNDPAANTGAHPQHSLWSGYAYYWGCLARDYHVGAWSVLVVLALTAVAVVAAEQNRLRPGATGILWFALVAAVLTFHHPYHASRFLHSWIPAVWVAAGIGAGYLVHRPLFALLTGALAVALLPALIAPAHAPEGGIHQGVPSALAVTDAYLPALADSRHAAVLSNVPMKFLA
ncbi:MAG: hypothetical protein M3Y28_12295, partial [Armatimonadota bacterium]|nr:hypothetical protein [Armatimonadota bacterium]